MDVDGQSETLIVLKLKQLNGAIIVDNNLLCISNYIICAALWSSFLIHFFKGFDFDN